MGGRFVSSVSQSEKVCFMRKPGMPEMIRVGGVAGDHSSGTLISNEQVTPQYWLEEEVRAMVRRFYDRILVWAVAKQWVTCRRSETSDATNLSLTVPPWSSRSNAQVIEPRNILELIELVGTELAEFENAPSQDNQLEELADAAIRIIQLYGEWGYATSEQMPSYHASHLDRSLYYVTHQAAEAWRVKGEVSVRVTAVGDVLFFLLCRLLAVAAGLTSTTIQDATSLDLDTLSKAIEAKMLVNDKRAIRHGKEA